MRLKWLEIIMAAVGGAGVVFLGTLGPVALIFAMVINAVAIGFTEALSQSAGELAKTVTEYVELTKGGST